MLLVAAAWRQAVADAASSSLTSPSSVYTIPLTRQLVPVEKAGRTIAHKTAYFGTVHVGFPQPQNFTVVFDTGSGHFFLPSTNCDDEPCLMHKRYNRSASETVIDIDHDGTVVDPDATERDQVSLAYGTGEVVGDFVKEVVCIGSPGRGDEFDPMINNHCVKVRVVTAREMSAEPFRLFRFDGVLGLGLEALALNPEFNFFEQLTHSRRLAPMFSVFLSRTDGSAQQSEISFGGHNPSLAAAPLQWLPVASPDLGYWQVNIRSMKIGNETVPLCEAGDCNAILDTGTTMLGVPKMGIQSLALMLARQVPGDPTEVNCHDVPGPDIFFDLGDITVRLTAEDYSAPAALRVKSKTSDSVKTICRSSLLPVEMPNVGPKLFIWGEPVLRRYYTAYNSHTKEIGFAPAAEPEDAEGAALLPSITV
eukprot:gnl/TRDRNA2_/TRDRNA2_38487_c0_seq1.p1 gnl/TRDRNA2_/TRDRNA2_38487_c0~~gnl/TRDRNA2_/TRDRNA2_38487_c0_seq1.p1  ORF type:complete len:455 (-),score=61.91 gnl/TRDRNA2_/TRDRNA2_38487_c0_seq1:17-1279(-)